jgi:hypothetical protein
MTRKETAAYLRQRGFPIGDSTLDKLCMPSSAQGPPIAAWWGRRPLYDPTDALAWAEARMRPAHCVSKSRTGIQQINSDADPQQNREQRNRVLPREDVTSNDLQKQKRRGRGERRSRN